MKVPDPSIDRLLRTAIKQKRLIQFVIGVPCLQIRMPRQLMSYPKRHHGQPKRNVIELILSIWMLGGNSVVKGEVPLTRRSRSPVPCVIHVRPVMNSRRRIPGPSPEGPPGKEQSDSATNKGGEFNSASNSAGRTHEELYQNKNPRS